MCLPGAGPISGSGCAQQNADNRAPLLFLFVFDPDGAAVGFDNRPADRQTQSEPLTRLSPPLADLNKAFEDQFFLWIGDTGTGIGNRQEDEF